MERKEVIRFHREAPAFLDEFARVPEMQRLRQVGMNCGCEYTDFPLFRSLRPYSRFRHSVSTARIVWDFTEDPVQTLATLFHDIATPTFAHSVDFLYGDHLQQESTEGETEQIIRGSKEIGELLKKYGVPVDKVVDYHRYPIADNDSPRLSADRLEYTLGNLENFGFCTKDTLQAFYDGLRTGQNEDGEEELVFSDLDLARGFGLAALRCSCVYVSPEDRYAMQMLSELLARAIRQNIISERSLYTTEPELICKLQGDTEMSRCWQRFRSYREMVWDETIAPEAERRVIPAKKRYIDPLVAGRGRLSLLEPSFEEKLGAFLSEDQTSWLCAR